MGDAAGGGAVPVEGKKEEKAALTLEVTLSSFVREGG